jgi:hypothetical protein
MCDKNVGRRNSLLQKRTFSRNADTKKGPAGPLSNFDLRGYSLSEVYLR